MPSGPTRSPTRRPPRSRTTWRSIPTASTRSRNGQAASSSSSSQPGFGRPGAHQPQKPPTDAGSYREPSAAPRRQLRPDEFFRQFAVTIAASTIISCFVSLTLSPALCAVLLLPHRAHDTVQHHSLLVRLVGGFFAAFNRGFEWLSDRFGRLTSRLIRVSAVVLIAYAGLTALTGVQFSRAPTGFIPQLDQGYLITVVLLPPGSSLARTDAIVREVNEILTATPGVSSTAAFAGLDGATLTNAP